MAEQFILSVVDRVGPIPWSVERAIDVVCCRRQPSTLDLGVVGIKGRIVAPRDRGWC